MHAEFHALLAFAAAAALLTIAPGLDTLLVLRTAAVEGTARAMMAGIGICAGCLLWGLLAAVGIGALVQASHAAYAVLRAAGAAYLTFLGIRMLLRRSHRIASSDAEPSVEPPRQSRADSPARWFARGLLTNLLNPKVGVFYLTFLPQFIPASVNATRFSMLLTSIHAAEGLLWFALIALATQSLSRWLSRPRVARSLDAITGIVFIGFGIELLFDRRG